MSGSLTIPILVAVGMLAGIAAFFQLSNIRGTKNRGRRRVSEEQRGGNHGAQQRRTDARVLTGNEKRLYAQAKTLLAEGKVQAASRILEQLNMQREAIQSLEDAGMIHEAAKILMRMGKHNRAGVVYARHGMWLDAASSFKMAHMPTEVAKCAREAGRFELAAEYFEKAGRFEDAAECFEKCGNLRQAARLFTSAGNRPRAMQLYEKLAAGGDGATAKLDADEVKAIVDHLCEGNLEAGLAEIAVRHNKITEIVSHLIAKGLASPARDIYLRATSDIGPQLMAEVNYRDKSGEMLAQLFLSVSHFQYAGMVFERMASFERAGAAFEQAEDFERSAYCFERAGRDDKARPNRAKAERAEAPLPGARYGNPGFALSNLPTDSSGGARFAPAEGDSTAVMGNAAAADAPPPPVAEKPAARPPVFLPPVAPTFSLSVDEDGEEAQGAAAPAPTLQPVLRILPREAAAEAGPVRVQVPAAAPNPALDPGHAAFHRAKFLSDLDFEQKNALWSIGQTVAFAEGEVVLTYDDEPKGVYVIVDGTVACFRNVGGKETYVDQMGASESFGELWLLADQPTAVRFVAQSAAQVRIIARDSFNELMDKDGTLARKVYKRFTLRLLKRLLRPQNNSKNQAAS